MSPPLDLFQLLTLTGSCQSFKNLGKRPVGTLGLMLISRLKRQTQPPTLGRTEIFSPGSRFLYLQVLLDSQTPFCRRATRSRSAGIFFDRLVVEGAENRWETYRRRPTCFRSLSENPSSSTSRLPSRRCASQYSELPLSPGWPAPPPWQPEIIASRRKKCKIFFSDDKKFLTCP